MTSPVENAGIRRKSSSIATLMTLNCNLPNIPIINEPTSEKTAAEVKKKAIRFDTNITSEYDSEEIRENKRKITDEMKSLWVLMNIFLLFISQWWTWFWILLEVLVEARLEVKFKRISMRELNENLLSNEPLEWLILVKNWIQDWIKIF